MDEKDFEIAAQLEQLERDSAIAKVRMKIAQAPAPADFDGECIECGSEIPQGRVNLGYTNCVDCVQGAEIRGRLGL